MNIYDVGDPVRLSGTLTHIVGTAVDPDELTITVRDPAGVETEYVYGDDVEVVRDDDGEYHLDISVDAPGVWFYRFRSTGTGQASDEKRFKVKASRLD